MAAPTSPAERSIVLAEGEPSTHPIQLARWANRRITLLPLGQGMKIQWDHSASRPRDAADAELEAYQRSKNKRQGLTDADATCVLPVH
jgi:hypothetical protein